ncbi:leucyl/phenylalanyl-tRNA--protein transferase [Herbaspirillum seropedicae]|uniref:Leucyl/phenylalanyl-tRNA--protein transferase n=1 Tax=Herbaspirillum seropedicae (strain SmR1) TaxID=757424 RepID=D8J1D4_HERSS|nr:leucyl/phenylalanyl-tRNA--protein transferase [Herbaspirillum seropedicae]ADJ64703.1 leucyl/phenylalanyl-tRNA-protein transferase protein [Herbaspirillum seropedicae SmR1]AKN66616.1 leucyl/phenylalanyl-tRNA--protein transferase [Herbaspirillum seropedicae]AON55457.1 leucyl/phenylalanyl-tRNA-protein transferase [Herbaspirillum seropedicae]MDR6397322.1 leucyl/phenylalanyl-tRNA--protein transferase [Herbaspirillum seropedicae]NQE28395.1 leucyl/phenylalanyl-tRNA--protein transferase [Herbaspiri
MIAWLDLDTPFPDVSRALKDPPGLLAAGADLSPARLLEAYRHGIFPWFSEGQPILWWSTDPRMVLRTDQFVVSDSLKKTLRRIERSRQGDGLWQVSFDTAFEQVMQGCAGPRRHEHGTWISPDIMQGYLGLHLAGYAHSAEVWLNGELVGGAYGVSIGRMFYGESMFARVSDASKVALAHLVFFLRSHGVEMIDCQQETSHLASLGARPIARSEFLRHLRAAIQWPQIRGWAPLDLLAAGIPPMGRP